MSALQMSSTMAYQSYQRHWSHGCTSHYSMLRCTKNIQTSCVCISTHNWHTHVYDSHRSAPGTEGATSFHFHVRGTKTDDFISCLTQSIQQCLSSCEAAPPPLAPNSFQIHVGQPGLNDTTPLAQRDATRLCWLGSTHAIAL